MKSSYQVVYTDYPWPDLEIEKNILDPLGCKILVPENDSELALSSIVPEAKVIATCWAKVPEKVIEKAIHCRGIVRLGIGLDNIDVSYATSKKLIVTNIPDYCLEEVADHALAMILSFARNISFFHYRTKSGEYDLSKATAMHRFSELTVGIVGLGGIGQVLYKKAESLGFRVIATTPSMNDHGTGCSMVTMQELLSRSDFISLHLPLNEKTHHLMGAKEFSRMKPEAYLINTSRGGLVDQEALYTALQDNQIAGAGLDVFDPEPPDMNGPLFRDERVVMTPHAAFVSDESLLELRKRTANQIADLVQDKIPENVINPEILE